MFLADEPAQKEILTVFCDVKGYSQSGQRAASQ